ncbi:MAG: hypothetical protein HKN82_19675, partial [Akkermansiaceae bacterium]|nr:hypothetical protein [Akkermansiaceae bacterium]
LQGAYFFGDFGSNRFWSVRYNGSAITELLRWDPTFDNLVIEPAAAAPVFGKFASISEGGDGEIYICTQPQINAGDSGGSVFVLTQKPFFRYRSTWFTTAELNDDAISGPDANHDGDQWTVAEEFALNTDPTRPNGAPWSTGFENDGGLDEFFTFTLEVSPEAKSVVTYTGESGGTLQDFNPANAVTGFEPSTGTTLKVRDLTPISASDRRFLFLGFDIPPAELEE